MFLIISSIVISISNTIIYSIINTSILRGVGVAAVSLYMDYCNIFYTLYQVYRIDNIEHFILCIFHIDYAPYFVYNKTTVKSGMALKPERRCALKNVVNDGIKLVKKNWTKNEKKATQQVLLSSQPQTEVHKL